MNTPEILYEDNDILVINKPAGLLVHPILHTPNSIPQEDTLVDWLIEHYPDLQKFTWPDPSRPGIVHRLDRDTSGVMVLAKTPTALAQLQNQFKDRLVEKSYRAIVVGDPDWETQTVRAPVSRGEGTRRKTGYLSLPGDQAKSAETFFRVIDRYSNRNATFTLIEAQPKTGRTHQIRVHLGLVGYPILGDPWYETKSSRKVTKELDIQRLLLHALTINFIHPTTGRKETHTVPLPADFVTVLEAGKE